MAPTANKNLDGHKLLVLLGVTGPPKLLLGIAFQPEWIAELKELFSGLEIVAVEGGIWNTPAFEERFPHIAPKLEYVQIQSAGANHIIQHPLFRDTDIALCTASGVHGYVFPRIDWSIGC
jgi:hypothetical protein